MRQKEPRIIRASKVIFSLSKESISERSSKFSNKLYTQPQLLALLCLKVMFNMTYRDFAEQISLMPELQRVLELSNVPHHTTLHKAMQRIDQTKINDLLAKTAKLTNNSGKAAIDSTFFQKGNASEHYLKRCDIEVKTQKAGIVIDTDTQMVIDLTLTNRRTHDTKLAKRLLKRVVKGVKIDKLVGDKGFDSEPLRQELRGYGILPVIKYRIFEPCTELANSVIDSLGYHKRSLIETVNSSIKRKYGDRLRSVNWFMQFKETKLKVVAYNIDRYLAICYIFFFNWPISQ
jgi:IS5 family transposase